MISKLTTKNRPTLPKGVLESLGVQPVPTHFEVDVEDGRIVLTPVHLNAADALRRKLADLGITDADVADAVAWARQRS
jgi:bifunctional DNA-binding transcriptional regulator/antitoxin component of YhaV-PrlF toxin-antitoxin module